MQKIYGFCAQWDEDARVWVVTSNDVPGLVAEAETLERLSTKLEVLIPELLDLNGVCNGLGVAFELSACKS
jgi:predicted RNase H-like HicB family nuclease